MTRNGMFLMRSCLPDRIDVGEELGDDGGADDAHPGRLVDVALAEELAAVQGPGPHARIVGAHAEQVLRVPVDAGAADDLARGGDQRRGGEHGRAFAWRWPGNRPRSA